MCSILVASFAILNLAYVNHFLKFRGPDLTNHISVNGYDFVHNLLHMTGEMTIQPFVSPDESIVTLYNGEIYNANTFHPGEGRPAYKSDGQCLLDAYEQFGTSFTTQFDGEFAVALFDFKRNVIVLSRDVFGTKPLWYGVHDGKLGISSYESGLERLEIPKEFRIEIDPNTRLILHLPSNSSQSTYSPYEVISTETVFQFDLRQYKKDTLDWQVAFQNAVLKRSRNLIHPLFIGLSSGYDSGLISAVLHDNGIQHYSFSIRAVDDQAIMRERIDFTANTTSNSYIRLTEHEFKEARKKLETDMQPYTFRKIGAGAISKDNGAVGLSHICTLARLREKPVLIYLSGAGADEVISDYGFQGEKIFPQSNFGGLFPENLTEIFPWDNFFFDSNQDYLMKEEHVSGAHGMEGRYPFLDKFVVQEFLWLDHTVKNGAYKRPIGDYFDRLGYPYKKGVKVGFAAQSSLVGDKDHDTTQGREIVVDEKQFGVDTGYGQAGGGQTADGQPRDWQPRDGIPDDVQPGDGVHGDGEVNNNGDNVVKRSELLSLADINIVDVAKPDVQLLSPVVVLVLVLVSYMLGTQGQKNNLWVIAVFAMWCIYHYQLLLRV